MSSRPQNLVQQAVLVRLPKVGPTVADEVYSAIRGATGASFYGRTPTWYPFGSSQYGHGKGGFLVAAYTYFDSEPLSSSDLERLIGDVTDGPIEGVAVTVSDSGTTSVEFGGV